jgi:hypothetical protein
MWRRQPENHPIISLLEVLITMIAVLFIENKRKYNYNKGIT